VVYDVHRKQNGAKKILALPERDREVSEQATLAAAILPKLMRQMFSVDDPLNDLPLAQLRVCGMLFEEPRSMSALSRELGVSLSAMTQLADRLERVGLVERVPEGSDRRVRMLCLTQQGQRIIQNHRAGRIGCVAAVFRHLSPASRTEILAALETLLRACEASKRSAPAASRGDAE
jgi:DNA-binding MarR family transcriptional regulator